ncbi:MAG TPA: hypothetical protein VER36_03560 [Flavisolibacter sp.]|nr:hypothetical protein [Flavisolibacter sp.]
MLYDFPSSAISGFVRVFNAFASNRLHTSFAAIDGSGWESMRTVNTKGVHPESNESAVINVQERYVPAQGKAKMYATLMLWKKAGEPWSDSD